MLARIVDHATVELVPLRVLFMPVPRAGNPYLSELARGLAAHGVTVSTGRGYAQLLPFLQAALKRPRPEIFHLHWTQPYLHWPRSSRLSRLLAWRLVFQLRVLRRRGVRIVWTVHNLGAHERGDKGAELHVSRRIAALCDALIVHCEEARRRVIDELDVPAERRERVVVVPHGHYLDAYPGGVTREQARSSLGLGNHERVLLLFGAMRAYKGAIQLLDAFRGIDDGNARLILAGAPFTDGLRRGIEAAAARDERVITRLQFVPDEDVPRLMRAADVAVVPFRDVLTSGSVALAMSFGLAVVAPRLGCLPESVADGGAFLYDPAAPDSLAAALRDALAADLAAMGRRNLDHIGALPWELVAELTIRLAYSPD
jgi:glycosyltransferase involved in cell wall biosynthesis